MRVAFLVQHGEPRYGYFDDTLVSLLCADARADGHEAQIVHVFFQSDGGEEDTSLREEQASWLGDFGADIVVVERAVDAESLAALAQGRTLLQLTRGDSLQPLADADYVLGALPGLTSAGRTGRTATVDSLRGAFRRFLRARAEGESGAGVPGIAQVVGGSLRAGSVIEDEHEPWPFEPVLEHQVLGESPPPPRHKTVFGNVGCPYSADPYRTQHYRDLEPAQGVGLSRLGCAFCPMGGDYQVRPDEQVVHSVLSQARYFADRLPELEAIVISDQAPLRYLAQLMRAAGQSGLRRLRWLFPCRAEAFLRGAQEVEVAVSMATEAGQVLECYLIGFEAFCDRELARYNKGLSVQELLHSVSAMRELAARHPGSFEYARAKGHSLVLFNPWTEPRDVRESLHVMREHGLAELFDEIGRNRLRLYSDLPITYAAQRDGALVSSGELGSGAARKKGYGAELGWRFLDARTLHLATLADQLRSRLGSATELGQLLAAVEFCETASRQQVDAVPAALQELLDALHSLVRAETRPKDLPRARLQRASLVRLSGACNNSCLHCSNADAYSPKHAASVERAIQAARASGQPVLFAGREPTLRAELPSWIELAAGQDARAVGIVSNARRLSYRAYATSCRRAGLRSVSAKLFAAEARRADAISRAPGAHEQALLGLRHARELGMGVEIRIPLHRDNLGDASAFVELASGLGASLRVEVALDAIGLAGLGVAARAVGQIVRACTERGVALEAAPPSAGGGDFRFIVDG